jgi:glutamate-ammonia-ligase adenylyltransferase
MQEATDKLYSEAYLTLLLRTVSSDGIFPRLAVELALVLRHADQQIVPATLVIEFTQAILASVDPQRAINHLLRYLDNVPDIAAFWATVVQYPEAFIGMMRLFASSQLLSSLLRRPQLLFWLLEGALWAPPPPPAVLAADLTQLLAGAQGEGEVATILRTFTQQHLLRIGARDLCGLASVEETTADLSPLADCSYRQASRLVNWLTALWRPHVHRR